MAISRFWAYLGKLRHVPPRSVIKKITHVLKRDANKVVNRAIDSLRPSRSSAKHRLVPLFPPISPESLISTLAPERERISELASHVLKHEFNLLGSGWVKVFRSINTANSDWLKNELNSANLEASQQIWQIIDSTYQAIDWQRDFKSGYRWHASTWFGDIVISPTPGTDIKVPWELARMQHLPVLIWAALFSRNNAAGFQSPEVYFREFRNQTLDFIATNPPRFGVNWSCPMDVGIRIANLLVARELFLSIGMVSDEKFEALFTQSVYDHARHLAGHPEIYPGAAPSNHYLADLCGLIFASGFLASTPETDRWLSEAAQAFIAQVAAQFLPDGGNFESSTSYHRLSAEMVYYTTALLSRLNAQGRLNANLENSEFLSRLQRIAEFTRDMIKPVCFTAVQIGDNDSGRFLILNPPEKCLDHRHLLATAAPFFSGPTSVKTIESLVVGALLENSPVFPAKKTASRQLPESSVDWIRWEERILALPAAQVRTSAISVDPNLWSEAPELFAYPDFGIYGYRNARAFLAIRCGSRSQGRINGHAHHDQLALELCIDGVDWIADPGTYLYTPNPEQRNRYRSVRAHFAPQFKDREPSPFKDLFALGPDPRAERIIFSARGFLGKHEGYGFPLYRRVELREGQILITDFAEQRPAAPWVDFANPITGPGQVESVPFSPGYGLIAPEKYPRD